MKLKAIALATAVLSAAPMAAHADTVLGLYVGGQGWKADHDGSYGYANGLQPFLVDGDETLTSFYAALEHPLPVIPNVKIRSNSLEAQGAGLSNRKSNFDNVDYTLYYEIFDNDIVSIDVGVNAKQFDGHAEILIDDMFMDYKFKGVVPTAYAATTIGLPFTNWSITGEAKAISFDDSSLHDVQAALQYRFIDNMAVDVSVSAGYRSVKMELDDVDNIYSDINFNGPFVSLDVHFWSLA